MAKKLLVIGSASIHTYNFIELVRGGFDEVALVTSSEGKETDYPSFRLDFSFGLGLLATIRRLKTIYKTFRPSIIHVHQANNYALSTLLALKATGTPIILTAWGSDVLINPKRNLLFKWMVPYILRQADSVTADSNYVLAQAQRLAGKPLDAHNINFGIDIDPCMLPKEPIVYSNRLHKGLYNIDKILLSFAAFHQNRPEWKLIVAGSGEQSEALQELARTLGIDHCTDFIGFVDAATNRECYCRSSIYVSVPQSDSISLSLVEAIAYGCIPFVSDLPANRELITDSLNGFIEKDPERIDFAKYASIDTASLNDERERLIRNFSKNVNRQRYLDLYESYLAL